MLINTKKGAWERERCDKLVFSHWLKEISFVYNLKQERSWIEDGKKHFPYNGNSSLLEAIHWLLFYMHPWIHPLSFLLSSVLVSEWKSWVYYVISSYYDMLGWILLRNSFIHLFLLCMSRTDKKNKRRRMYARDSTSCVTFKKVN
jgi:hypothetical protein